jgi:hypothetical protein
VAVQLTGVAPTGNAKPEAGVHVTVGLAVTASVAVAVNVTTAVPLLPAVALMFAGTVSLGAVVSCTVTLNDLLVWRPPESVALQVTWVVPSGKTEPEVFVQLTAGGFGSWASVAVAVNVTTAPLADVASTVMFDGTVTTGGVFVLMTVTVKCPVWLFCAASVAVQFTVFVPIGNAKPEAGVQLGVIVPDTRSVAVALYVTTAVVPVVVTEMGAGKISVGGVLSCTVTLNDADPCLPRLSDAVQLTVVVVTPNVDPDAGVQFTRATGPSCVSVALAVNVTTAPLADVASTVMFDGTVTVGAVF